MRLPHIFSLPPIATSTQYESGHYWIASPFRPERPRRIPSGTSLGPSLLLWGSFYSRGSFFFLISCPPLTLLLRAGLRKLCGWRGGFLLSYFPGSFPHPLHGFAFRSGPFWRRAAFFYCRSPAGFVSVVGDGRWSLPEWVAFFFLRPSFSTKKDSIEQAPHPLPLVIL